MTKKIKPIILPDDFRVVAGGHSFNVSIASALGLTEAILLQNFYHWHQCNKGNDEMFKDGHVWFFRSIAQIVECYPYLSSDKVRYAIDRLIESGFMLKGNYSEDKMKKASWYSLSSKALSLFGENTTPFGKKPNDSGNYQLNYSKEYYSIEDLKKEKDIDISISKKKEEEIDWKTDFNAYLMLVEEAKRKLFDDTETRAKKQKYYPDIDYELSIEKMIDDFWGTERGWKHKVKSSKKTKEIDMAKTLANGFDLSANRVYKKVQKQGYTPNKTATLPKLNDGLVRPKDGVNADGTFNKNGFKYYHSVRDNIDYSIPLNSPPMPSFECEYDTLKQEWYYPKDNNDAYGELW